VIRRIPLDQPSAVLPETELALKSLKAVHPQAETITGHLRWLGAVHLIEVSAPDEASGTTSGTAALSAEFDTPNGLRTLK
jgi:hypothetical protein